MKSKPLSALLLAAGYGTRLRPITLNKPKCLINVNDKPILEDWLIKLEAINTKKILVNTHYLHQKVDNFLKTQDFRSFELINIYEEKLLGTAGTLLKNYKSFLETTIIMIHADNFTTLNLKDLIMAHHNRPKGCLLTMLVFNCSNPSSCGIVKLNKQKIVEGFFEKHPNPPGDLANGAVYVFEDELLNWMIKFCPEAEDFSTQVIPKLIGKIFTYHTKMPYIDIGTPSALSAARRIAFREEGKE